MSAQAAIDTNATTAAPPSMPPNNKRSLAQEGVAREFVETYGIDDEQIYFSGDSVKPYFGLEALSMLRLELAPHIVSVSITEANRTNDYATSECTVILKDGRNVQAYAACAIGEATPDGSTVTDIRAAVNLSQAKAQAKTLRLAGFDAVREHNRRKNGEDVLDFSTMPFDTQVAIKIRRKELALIHIYKKTLGLSDVIYQQLLSKNFEGLTSARDMSDKQRVEWVAILCALVEQDGVI